MSEVSSKKGEVVSTSSVVTFWMTFFEMFWACNCGKISDNSNFTQSTQLLRILFVIRLGTSFGGDGFAGRCVPILPKCFYICQNPEWEVTPPDFQELYTTVATSSNKPHRKSFVSVWRSLFCTHVSLLQKSVALRFLTELLVSEKQKFKGTSFSPPLCLSLNHSFNWIHNSSFGTSLNYCFGPTKTLFSATIKSLVHCGDSGWWSMPIFSGVFVARNVVLNSQLTTFFKACYFFW